MSVYLYMFYMDIYIHKYTYDFALFIYMKEGGNAIIYSSQILSSSTFKNIS